MSSTGAATAALHPLRLEILRELAQPESAAGLARRIGIPRQQVNYHIRQLEGQGLVKLVGERRVRNCIERLVQAVGRSYVISPAALGGLAADPARIEDEGSAAYLVAVASQMVEEVAGLQHRPGQADKEVRTLALPSRQTLPVSTGTERVRGRADRRGSSTGREISRCTSVQGTAVPGPRQRVSRSEGRQGEGWFHPESTMTVPPHWRRFRIALTI
jgi:DNA-binding transcriptional ArsR family regulator